MKRRRRSISKRKPAPRKSTLGRGLPQLAAVCSRAADRAVDAVVEAWTLRYRLTPSERAMLFASTVLVAGHATIAESRGVKTDTARSQAGAVCRKTGARGLTEAAVLVLREALQEVFTGRHGA